MNTHIRKAEFGDLETLLKLAKNTFIATYAHLNDPINFQQYLDKSFVQETFQNEFETPKSEFYILEIKKELVAYIKLNIGYADGGLEEEDSIELERIYIKQTFQGNGYGKLLIDHAVKVGKKNGMKVLWLGVWEKNLKAIKFYEKCGFHIFGTHIFTIGKEDQTDFLMRLDIEN